MAKGITWGGAVPCGAVRCGVCLCRSPLTSVHVPDLKPSSASVRTNSCPLPQSRVGSGDGWGLGSGVGDSEGADVGSAVGCGVGIPVGDGEGADVGSAVGCGIGIPVGAGDGTSIDVGRLVGT